jgi:mRNA interferase ChpB
MKGKVFERGDIVRMGFDPAKGMEQQGTRPAFVVTPYEINRLGMLGVCPITQGGMHSRNIGMAVSLMGAGLETAGVVLVQQFRMIDPKARACAFIESAPEDITEEVRARVAALVD